MAKDELGCAQGKTALLLASGMFKFVHQELRPQDSIPFLRRVSADLQKTDAAKVLAQINSPIMEAPSTGPLTAEEPSPQQNVSFGPVSPLPDDTPVSPRNHNFVKTIFGKCKQLFHPQLYST